MAKSLSRRALWMQKLAEEVVRSVTERVRDGGLRHGDRLGTRDDLARDFVTSPAAVDRAVEMLAAAGVVFEAADASLRIAADPSPEQAFELPQSASARLADVIAILELRIGVEVESAGLCALRRSEAELAAIRDAAEAHEATASAPARAAQADLRFHRAIAAATANSYIIELLDYLGPLLIPRRRIRLSSDIGANAPLALSFAEHAAIVTAIEARDAGAARQAMQGHLQRSIELLRALAGKTPLPD